MEGDRDKQTPLDKIWTRILVLDSEQAEQSEGERLPISGAGGWSREERVGEHFLKARKKWSVLYSTVSLLSAGMDCILSLAQTFHKVHITLPC